MRIPFALAALLLAASAHAQAGTTASAALGWTNPTTYVDTTALAPSAIAGTAVFFGPQSRFSAGTTLRAGCTASPNSQADTSCYPNAALSTGSGTAFTATFTITQSSTMYFAVVTKATNGALSAYSSEASKSFTVTTTPTPPNAPTTITITITLGACTTNVPGTTCTATSP